MNAPHHHHLQEAVDPFCPGCGYNLRGIDSLRCPECGYDMEFLRRRDPQLPWLHRRELGTVQAYWQTVLTAIHHKRRLWEELSRPVDLREARRFRWVTVCVAYAPLLLLTLALFVVNPGDWLGSMTRDGRFLLIIGSVILHLWLFLLLAWGTGLTRHFFTGRAIPPPLQDRAGALSLYCYAPLGLAPLAYLVLLLTPLFGWAELIIGVLFCILFGIYLALRIAAECLIELAGLHRRVAQSFSGAVRSIVLLVPLAWAFLAGLLLCVLSYAALVITSLLGIIPGVLP